MKQPFVKDQTLPKCDQHVYLKKDSYLGEFKTHAEKAKARQNLGIPESQSYSWGNISGDILEQEDLKIYLESLNRIEITNCKISPSIAEVGETIPEVTITWETNKEPILQKVDEQVVLENSFTIFDVQDNTSKTIRVYDGYNSDDIELSILFKQGLYYGTSSNTKITQDEFLSNFARTFDVSEVTVNPQNGEYIFFMLPVSYANSKFLVGGIEGGFRRVSTNFKFTKNGVTFNAVVFRSDNHSLGKTTINVKK